MIWEIERFDAQCARGWVCLPDRSASATLVFYSGKGQQFTVECSFMRADLKKQGVHQTGRCGFFVGPKVMEGLYQSPIVAIFEETSRMLLHRHSAEVNFIDSRILFLTAPAVDNAQVMASLGAHHRLYYRNAEALDDDTLNGLLKSRRKASVLLCAAMGRRPAAMDRALNSGQYRAVTLLTPPVVAFMRQIGALAAAAEGLKETRFVSDPDLADVADSLKNVDLRRPDDVGKWLARTSEPGLLKLSNPLVRFYAGADLDEELTPAHLSAALRTLGLLSAVGLTERLGEFGQTLGALIGAPDLTVEAETPSPDFRAMIEAAQRPEIETLTALDRTLYDLVAYALASEEPSLEVAGEIIRR